MASPGGSLAIRGEDGPGRCEGAHPLPTATLILLERFDAAPRHSEAIVMRWVAGDVYQMVLPDLSVVVEDLSESGHVVLDRFGVTSTASMTRAASRTCWPSSRLRRRAARSTTTPSADIASSAGARARRGRLPDGVSTRSRVVGAAPPCGRRPRPSSRATWASRAAPTATSR